MKFKYWKETGENEGYTFEYEPSENILELMLVKLIIKDYFKEVEDKGYMTLAVLNFINGTDMKDTLLEQYHDMLQEEFEEKAYEWESR